MKAALAVGAAIFYAASISLLADLEPVYSAYINIADPAVIPDSPLVVDGKISESDVAAGKIDPRIVILRVGVPSYTRLNLKGGDHKGHVHYKDFFRIESHCDRYDTLSETETCTKSAKTLATKLPYTKKSKPESGRHKRKFLLNFSQLWSAFLRIVAMAALIVIAVCAVNLNTKATRQLSIWALITLALQLFTYIMTVYITNPKLASYLGVLHSNLKEFYETEDTLAIVPPHEDSFLTLAALGLLSHLVVMLMSCSYLYFTDSANYQQPSEPVVGTPPADQVAQRSYTRESERGVSGQSEQIIPIDDN